MSAFKVVVTVKTPEGPNRNQIALYVHAALVAKRASYPLNDIWEAQLEVQQVNAFNHTSRE